MQKVTTSININAKKNHKRSCAVVLAVGFFLAAANIVSASTILTGNIKINGRQLLVNGVPFVMKGICYSPVRKGETYPDGLMTLNSTPDDLVTIEQDFQMMQAVGINTIRTYEPIVDPAILALLTKYQLRTIVPICPSWGCYQDLDAIAQKIEILKKEPSTLVWEVGNEWNLNHFYTFNFMSNPSSKALSGGATGNLSNQQCLDLIQTVTNLIRQYDSTHPVGTDTVNPIIAPNRPNIYTMLPDCVDMNGFNIYHGLDFGPNFSQWNKINDKPLYIGETGAVAWNSNINAEDDASQAVGVSSLANKIMSDLSAANPNNVLVGGCVFEWCDEWWKDGSPLTHDHDEVPMPYGGPYPDHTHHGEWFGIVDIDRNPRAAYYALKDIFNPPANN